MINQYKATPDEEYWTKKEFSKDIKKLAKKNTKEKPLFSLLLEVTENKKKILEAGAGNGWIVYAMRKRGIKWTGVEFSKKLVDNFKSRFPKYKDYMYYGDARSLPFEDNFFDSYFSPGVIEHYENESKEISKILEEAKRVVKKEGSILVSVPIMNLPRTITFPIQKIKEKKTRHLPFYQTIYSRRELKKRLNKSGLKIKKEHGCGVHDFKLFGKKVFPSFLHRNKILNYLFNHMVLVECINR